MSQVCDTEQLQTQLLDADAQVANVQESFTTPLSQLEHAASVSVLTCSWWADQTVCLTRDLLPPRRKWKPSKAKSGRCRANWRRWRSCCRRRRLYPNTRRRNSRWENLGGDDIIGCKIDTWGQSCRWMLCVGEPPHRTNIWLDMEKICCFVFEWKKQVLLQSWCVWSPKLLSFSVSGMLQEVEF